MLTAFSADPVLPAPVPDKMVPRLVVAEDGRVVHTSEGFEQLVRASSYALVGSRLQDLIIFCEPDMALRDQPFSMMATDAPLRNWCSTIVEGVHKINLRDRGDRTFLFQFNWMQVGNGNRYLVASENETGIERTTITDDETEKLLGDPMLYGGGNTSHQTPLLKNSFTACTARIVDDSDKTFLDLSDDLMIRLSPDGRVEQGNRAFFTTLHYPIQALQILNFVDLVAPDDRAHVRSVFMALVRNEAGNTPITFETRTLDARQKQHIMDWRLKRVGNQVYALGRDLTATREREADLLRNQQQLSEAEAIAHMGYWRWQVGETQLAWSDEIYRIFGVARDVFTPTIDRVNAMVGRRDIARVIQAFQRAMIEQNSYDMDFRITRPDGQTRYIRCEGRCETDDLGDVIALYGIMQDMTESAESERKLREAKDAAERAYDSKSKFLANMSHELRTPLNAIIGFSEMMQRQLLGPIGTEKYLDYIDGIRQSGEHLLDLISDILDMSKIEAGKYTLDLEPVNIAKLARLAISMVEGRARDACVDLGCNDFGDDIQIMADRRGILQMMLNLLSNSIKFTEPGGSVRLDLNIINEKVKLAVSDTGIGIPAGMLATIATPFEQAANHYTRSHEGSGLGLAITKELTLMHGGHLDIQSEVGKGTQVTIILPVQQQSA